ncbi:hypothetical protein [Photobacterium minamisatsumaniensis]|uniref:hypothetical protein n=1 Tax=Photobacterium minamisatsumaniensis TaxID=2910233 RepID=UPI003D0F1B96
MKNSIVAAALITLFNSAPVYADVFGDAAKLGANAGAMQFCKRLDRENEGKYDLLGLRTMGEFDDLSSRDRAKALIYREKAEERGIYLNNPLDKSRCKKLRRTMHLAL